MSKEKVFIEEMKGFNISVDDIKPSDDLFGAIEKAIIKMQHEYYVDRLEVVLNNNLIETKDKTTNFRTILGCRVSYDDLADSISFIVRQDTKPSYEELEERINKATKIVKENEYFINYVEASELLSILTGDNNDR